MSLFIPLDKPVQGRCTMCGARGCTLAGCENAWVHAVNGGESLEQKLERQAREHMEWQAQWIRDNPAQYEKECKEFYAIKRGYYR